MYDPVFGEEQGYPESGSEDPCFVPCLALGFCRSDSAVERIFFG